MASVRNHTTMNRNNETRFITAGVEDRLAENVKGLLDIKTFKDKISCGSLGNDVRTKSGESSVTATLQPVLEKWQGCDAGAGISQESFITAVELTRLQYEEAVREGRLHRSAVVEGKSMCTVQPTEPYVRIRTLQSAQHPDHPVNHLADIERELFSSTAQKRKTDDQSEHMATNCKKLREITDTVDSNYSIESYNLSTEVGNSSEKSTACGENRLDLSRNISVETLSMHGSLWDLKLMEGDLCVNNNNSDETSNIPVIQTSVTVNSSQLIKKKKVDYSKSFIMLPDTAGLVPLYDLELNKVCPDALLEQFPTYNVGAACRTLYIKNLPRDCNPHELVRVFGNFDTGRERTSYRILTGRMKGQAFVRLTDRATAETALRYSHGYKIRNKPMVIEYAKDKS